MPRRKRQSTAQQKAGSKGKERPFNRPFNALRQQLSVLSAAQIEKAEPPPPPEPAAEQKSEEDLFLQAMQGVKTLSGQVQRIPATHKQPPPVPSPTSEDDDAMIALYELVAGRSPFDISDCDEHVEGLSPGLDPRILKKLRKGAFSIRAHLDLHGMFKEEARVALSNFVSQAQLRGHRCVLVVHGRGLHSKDQQPVLKEAVVNWLGRSSLRKQVLAFCSARPYDGGAGALYVLLRRPS